MRINAPHMKTESLPSSISASALWMRLLSPLMLCLVLLRVRLCLEYWLRDVYLLCPRLCSGPGDSAVVATVE